MGRGGGQISNASPPGRLKLESPFLCFLFSRACERNFPSMAPKKVYTAVVTETEGQITLTRLAAKPESKKELRAKLQV